MSTEIEISSEIERYPVTTIGDSAFKFCSGLTSITIPKSVTSIGKKSLGYTDDDKKIDGFKIHGYLNSSAESYAKGNGFEFINIEETTPQAWDLDQDYNITIKDFVVMKKLALGISEVGTVEDYLSLVDLNQDGKFTSVDLVLMINKILEA